MSCRKLAVGFATALVFLILTALPVYIKFGKPDGIESHLAGGMYQRMSYEGTGSTTTYPFERWFYRHIPGVRSGVEIEFVDPTGSGEYRLAIRIRDRVSGKTLSPSAKFRVVQ